MRWKTRASGAAVACGVAVFLAAAAASPVRAQEPFIGQLQFLPYNFAPRGWAFCNGQLLSIAQNTALFSLLGTTFGGDGRTTFGLPDMRGRMPIHPGQGPGLSPRTWGEKGGSETVTLTASEMSPHAHPLNATTVLGNTANPTGAIPARDRRDQTYADSLPDVAMHPDHIFPSGQGLPHENMPPWLALNCNIAMAGVFPARP